MRTKLHALSIGAACSLVMLAACNKGEKPVAGAADTTTAVAPDTSGPKTASIPLHDFTGDVKLASEGRQLFLTYNCYGCHGGLAGGAMGPSLRDTTWKYGGTDSLIYRTIHDGRPMGMPAWGSVLSDAQIKALITYIHSLRTKAEPQYFFAANGDTAATAANAAPPPSPTNH
ncbi:MAG: c-type cytochrome [Gemmatimonadaceae bacterium]